MVHPRGGVEDKGESTKIGGNSNGTGGTLKPRGGGGGFWGVFFQRQKKKTGTMGFRETAVTVERW